tara:strand:+ start:12412 stop:13701 length:1290 start_codon:yes stop_codon:yes gene_type:complete
MEKELIAWVEEKEKNGVLQHSDEWHKVRKYTVGGSTMAVLEGCNPYGDLYKFLEERLGIVPFRSGTAMQWGNLFEYIIQQYIELDIGAVVYGENLYIAGPPGASYSPDGFAMVDCARVKWVVSGFEDDLPSTPSNVQLTLLEFKCPYSRIPKKSVPIYYVPQVKMGLSMLKYPTTGLFAETVIRRTKYEDLGYNVVHDTTLVSTYKGGDLPLAYGIIGFYIDGSSDTADSSDATDTDASTEFTLPTPLENFYYHVRQHFNHVHGSNDFGSAPPELFKLLLALVDTKQIKVKYYDMVMCGHSLKQENCSHKQENCSPKEEKYPPNRDNSPQRSHIVDANLKQFIDSTAEESNICIGIVPYKVFMVDYHNIAPTEGYFEKHYPMIVKITEFLKSTLELSNAEKRNALDKFYPTVCPDAKPRKKKVLIGFSD